MIAAAGMLPAAARAQSTAESPGQSTTLDPRPGSSETATNTVPTPPAIAESTMPRTTRRAREASLVAVLVSRRQAEAELRALQAELQSDAARGRESDLERKVRAIAAELERLNRSFSELATGVDPLSLDAEPEAAPFELARELRVLLSPLINELKRATSRPRELDRLRTEIAELESQMKTIDKAIAKLDVVRDASKDTALVKELGSERTRWTRRRATVEATLEVAQQKLDQRAAETQSIAESIQEIFAIFFKSRGRNLLLALVAMLSFLVVLRRLRAFLSKRRQSAQRVPTFQGRLFGLVYSVFTVVGAIVVFVVALYFFGDWVLLILALLLILGLIWASKQALPRFWSQAVLILDMGVVREGQRVIWNGLVWRVESIAFYCVLSNPALTGGSVRIPIEDLASLRSRSGEDDEPWFPTRVGDVVLLADGRAAAVEFQSTEIVRLQTPGGNRVVVPTAQFASQSHEILSNGYRVDLEFGLDYENRAEITTTDRETMETEVERSWRASPWAGSLVGVAVEFSRAGPSSLDYFIRVDLDGSQATEYAAQKRHLARICVDVCNENGWNIPFQQLTIHVAQPPTA